MLLLASSRNSSGKCSLGVCHLMMKSQASRSIDGVIADLLDQTHTHFIYFIRSLIIYSFTSTTISRLNPFLYFPLEVASNSILF